MAIAAGVLATGSVLWLFAALRLRSDRLVMQRAGASPYGSVRERTQAQPRIPSWIARAGRLGLPDVLVRREGLERGLRSARLDDRVSVDDVVGVKMVGALLGAAASLLVPGSGPIPGALFAMVGYRAPDFLLARSISRRRAAMDRELPQLLDLLAAASQAGLAGPLALRRCADAIQGPLAEELRRVLDAVDLGGRWRDELRVAAQRLDLLDLRRAVAALTRTETLGASLADAMSDLAARVREARRTATAEAARTAPVKMLFPLVFLVLPAFLLLTVVPVLFTTLRSIR